MALGRGKKAALNMLLAVGSQCIVVVAGLFLPRALIVNYSSEINGVVTSLQQIVSYLALVEGGIAGSAMAALYDPLAKGDVCQVSVICSAAKRFYNKAGVVFLILVVFCGLVYPCIVSKSDFSSIELFLFVVLSGVNGATQLLFIGKYKVLLMASRNNGFVSVINALSTALYSLVFIVLACFEVQALVAFFFSTCAYFARAIAFWALAKKLFPEVVYDLKCNFKFDQQKDVLLQQILTMLILNSPAVIMTVLGASLSLMSVYSVYNLVLASIFMLFYSVESTMTTTFGNIIVLEDRNALQRKYLDYIRIYSILWTGVFTCLISLYLPFVQVYTLGIEDAIYVRPVECGFFVAIAMCWTLRNAQTVLFTAAGRFRELRSSFVMEAVLCIVLSSLGFYFYGLVGLLFGRLCASAYRVFDFAWRNSRYVLGLPIRETAKAFVAAPFFLMIGVLGCQLIFLTLEFSVSIGGWLARALVSFALSALCSFAYAAATNQLERIRSLLPL